MTADQVRQAFQELTADQRLRVVATLAYLLTVAARGAWSDGGEPAQVAGRLHALNELQHTVAGKLLALTGVRAEEFPDQGFLDVLFEKAHLDRCEWELSQALDWSLRVLA